MGPGSSGVGGTTVQSSPLKNHRTPAFSSRIETPCLILQGERDPFGTRDEVAAYKLSSAIRIHWLEDGEHSFIPRKKSGRTQAENWDEAIEVMAGFIKEL